MSVQFCWVALPLEPKPIFSGVGANLSKLFAYFSQCRVLGSNFDALGSYSSKKWRPFGLHLGLEFTIISTSFWRRLLDQTPKLKMVFVARHLRHILGEGGTGTHLEPFGTHLDASGTHLGRVWEAWAPKVPPRGSEWSEAQKLIPLSAKINFFTKKYEKVFSF